MRTPVPPRSPAAPATALGPGLGTVLGAVLATAAVLTGCADPIPGSAVPAGGASAPSGPPAPGGAAGDPAGACRVVVAGPGSIRVSGGSNRAVTRDDQTSLGCGDGPLVVVEVADGGIDVTPEGGRPVRIEVGRTAAVGGYEITVDGVAGEEAEFVVVPPA